MIDISAVILNWNGWLDTRKCLESLSKVDTNGIKLQIIVVDNASSDNSAVNIRKFFPGIHLIVNKGNFGFAQGNNIGIKQAYKSSDYILILNNDTICHKDLLIQLVKTSKTFQAQLLSPKIYFLKGHEFHKIYNKEDLGKVFWYGGGIIDWKHVIGHHRGVDEVDIGQYDSSVETDFTTGACMLIKSEVFKKIGFFNEKYFLYYEDLDFCQRAKLAGFKINYCPGGLIWHKNAGSLGSGSALQDYYITRNRLLFGMTYAPFRLKLSLFKESLKLLVKGRFWQKRAVRDFYTNNFGIGSYE